MTTIDSKNIETLIRGASIFTCAGGFPMEDQLKWAKELVDAAGKKFAVELKDADELPGQDYMVSLTQVGPSDAPEISKREMVGPMIDAFEKVTGKKIAAICPPEIGQEAAMASAAYWSNRPLIDCDYSGGRAVPMVDMNSLVALGIPFKIAPMVVATDRNEVVVFGGETMDDMRAEEALRHTAQLSTRKAAMVLYGLTQIQKIQGNAGANRSYSKALEFGKLNSKEEILAKLNPKLTLELEITGKTNLEAKGFKSVRVEGKEISGKGTYTLVIYNETMFVLNDKGKVTAEVPEMISTLDSKTGLGAHGKDFTVGKRITVAVSEPEKAWQTAMGRKLLGAERFEFLLNAK